MTTTSPKLLLPALLSATRSYRPAARRQPGDLQSALMNLADQPATHTSFSFDRAELQIAQNLLESNGMDANRAPAALTGISSRQLPLPPPGLLHA